MNKLGKELCWRVRGNRKLRNRLNCCRKSWREVTRIILRLSKAFE